MRVVSVRFSRLGVLVLMVALALLVLAVPAFAAGDGTPQVANLFDAAQIIALIGGVVIPFVVALLAKQQASGLVKSAIAAASAALLGLGTYLTDTNGAHTWKGALSVFVIALVSAAASRVTVTGGADAKLNAATANFGIGTNQRKP